MDSGGDLRDRTKEVVEAISKNPDFEIDTLEIAQDHIHSVLSFPPRYTISRAVGILKSISAGVIFTEHPEVKKELWGGELWEDGLFC
jgi:putative transposase